MDAAAVIIPGLPNDIAMLCLVKVPRIYHACLSSVSIVWHKAVRRPQFYHERRRLGISDAWLVLVSLEIHSAPRLLYSAYDLSTKQLLFKVQFPPSLPVDARTRSIFAGGTDDAINVACTGCATLIMGSTHVNAAHHAKLADITPPESALSSLYVSGTSLDTARIRNSPACGSKHGGGASADADACFHYLDNYRIAAMNEYFAVLGFTHGSRRRATICTFTIYNTVTDEWQHAQPLTISRKMFAYGVINGRLYVAGGSNEKGETERMTEVYDFAAGKWGIAARLPEGVGRIQGDVVFQEKLYVQCWEEEEDGNPLCVFWVYNPRENQWKKLNGRLAGAQQLLATDNFLYAIGAQEELSRYESRSGQWMTVGRRRTTKPTTLPEKGFSANLHNSQKAFAHGDDIFLLQETSRASSSRGLPLDGFTKCHRLPSVKPSWYHAGAVVRA